LSLGAPFCLDKITPDDLILAGALASRQENDDTIDLAVLGGLKDKGALKRFEVTHFTPFDPVHKRTEATVKGEDGRTFKVTKGAPQVILGLSTNAAAVEEAVDKAVNDFAARGFRALGIARADDDGKWRLLGVLPLFDPPRVDAKETIATAAKMGVKIKMVTGDALAIAREMAKTLGMGANILDGGQLGDSETDETAEVAKEIENADGFAQVFPEHKFHIVDVMQKHDHIVGMTGDGVNDAPALKKADCGFAVSGATDAARAAASIVLVMPGLGVIIDAIKESREIFQRMNSYAIYRIAETLRVLLFMTLAIVVFNFFPVTAIMIVMLALLNDGAILSIAYDNVRYRNQPEVWDMRTVLTIATVLGLVGPIAAFGLFYIGDKVLHIDRPQLQTMMYLLLSVAGHLTIFQTRTRGPWWSIRPAPILLGAVVGTQILATAISLFGFLVTPLWWGWAALVWTYALGWFLLTDPLKLLGYRVLAATAKAAPKRQDEDKASDAKGKLGTETGSQAEPKPEEPEAGARGGASPASKPEPQPAPKAGAKPAEATKPAEAKSEPRSDAKPDGATPEVNAEASPASKPEPQLAPNAGAKSAESEPKLRPDGKIEGADLLDMKLGDVILAGIAKDPQGAGRFIAQAITELEAAPGPTPSGQAGESQLKLETAATSESGPALPPATTPKAAE
jgi:H+-transporting ATPase